MKFQKLFLFILFTFCFLPLYAEIDLDIDLTKFQAELTQQLNSTEAIKRELLEAMDIIDNSNWKKTFTSTDYGNLLKEKMSLLPKKERLPFINTLISKAEEKGLIKDLNWYFMAEEAYAKPIFSEEIVQQEAKKIVESLEKNFITLNEKSLAKTIKKIKIDIIKMVSQENNITLLNTFNKAFRQQAALYPNNEVVMNLFLKDVTNGNLIIDIMSNLNNIPRDHFARDVMPALMQHFSVENFVVTNKKDFLTSILRTKAKRSSLQEFTNILVNHTKYDIPLTEAQKLLMTKIDILNTISEISNPKYEELKWGHAIWQKGERASKKIEALNFNFGELSPQNAKELNKIIKDVPLRNFEKVLPSARSWMESFTAWAKKSLQTKGGAALSITSMVAITIAGELIKNATANTSLTYSYDNIDKITDALADNNMITLVYNNVYDNKFNIELDNYIAENSLDNQQETDFIKTHFLFEEALYANFIDKSDEFISEEIWRCSLLKENCEA